MTLAQCHALLLLVAYIPLQVVLPLPVKGHFFMFWKTTSQELLPHIGHLQKETRGLILKYFQSGLVNQTQDSEHSMESAKDLYDRLNLTKFPSERVLSRDNRTQFIFIKGLLKENFRLCDAYSKILLQERHFRCDLNDEDSEHICEKTKDLQRGLREVTEALMGQLRDFFLVQTSKMKHVNEYKRERKIQAYLNKKKLTDETNAGTGYIQKDASDDIDIERDVSSNHGNVADMDSSRAMQYRKRNRASVGVLYAIYVHLMDTEGTLRYALRLLEPSSHRE